MSDIKKGDQVALPDGRTGKVANHPGEKATVVLDNDHRYVASVIKTEKLTKQ